MSHWKFWGFTRTKLRFLHEIQPQDRDRNAIFWISISNSISEIDAFNRYFYLRDGIAQPCWWWWLVWEWKRDEWISWSKSTISPLPTSTTSWISHLTLSTSHLTRSTLSANTSSPKQASNVEEKKFWKSSSPSPNFESSPFSIFLWANRSSWSLIITETFNTRDKEAKSWEKAI